MLRNWRAWALLTLLLGPSLLYIGLGALWLVEHRGPIGFPGELLTYGMVVWIGCGIALAVLGARWTRTQRPLLPPIDWDAPRTFAEFDRRAWDLVQEASELGDTLPMEALSDFDTYINTGRQLARRLAAHYHPLATDPIEHVPVVDLLTALQLAAEDLNGLCREVPGGDMITPSHWKKAVQAAGYLQRANDLYALLLPIFQPATGLARLGAQKLMVQPAWRNMQHNLMRWFFHAFINRLGTHLIELYSGRLAIGAEQYRRLTRKLERAQPAKAEEPGPLVIAVAGARGAGKSQLITALDRARAGDLGPVRARLTAAGFDAALVAQLETARFVEIPGYTVAADGESSRDRLTRREAVAAAVETDLLLLVVDAGRLDPKPETRFLDAWEQWYAAHPTRERPPALAVLTRADRPDLGGDDWQPPYDWARGQRPRELAVRTRIETLRALLPPTVSDVVAVGLRPGAIFGVAERLLPELALLLHRAERIALLRFLHRDASRSKARRLAAQVGRQGRRLWEGIRSSRHKPAAPAEKP